MQAPDRGLAVCDVAQCSLVLNGAGGGGHTLLRCRGRFQLKSVL